jgi:hypothetical protein
VSGSTISTVGKVSGTVGETVFMVDDVIREAYGAIMAAPITTLTGGMATTAQNQLYLFSQQVVTFGHALWCREQLLIPMQRGVASYRLPLGSADIVPNVAPARRLSFMPTDPTGLIASDGIPPPAFLLDQTPSPAQKYVQSLPGGWLGYDFGAGNALSVATVGLMPGNTDPLLTIVWENSDDGVTWSLVNLNNYVDQPTTAVGGFWQLFCDIRPSTPHRFWRVRSTGSKLTALQIFIGWQPSDIPMGALNLGDYANMPDKTRQGDPLQYYLDRQRDAPVIRVWPAPMDNIRQIYLWRKRQIMDVGGLMNVLDFPARWHDCVVTNLAARLLNTMPAGSVDPMKAARVSQLAPQLLRQVTGTEEDHAVTRLRPQIRRYTR